MKTCLLTASLLLACSLSMAQSNSRQATEAVQKHRAEAASAAKPSATQPSPGSLAKRLESCKAAAGYNLIKREQCVWNLCAGHWGRHGCPSQAKNNPSPKP